MTTRLSKSRYLSGLQCLKRLYLEIHARELATPFDEETHARLAAGAVMAGPSGADTVRAERPRTGLRPDRE